MLKLALVACGLLVLIQGISAAPTCSGCRDGDECREVGSTWDINSGNLCITYTCKKLKKNTYQTKVKTAACLHNGRCIKSGKSVDEENCRKAQCIKTGNSYILNIFPFGCMDVDGKCQKPSKKKFAAIIHGTRYEKCQCKTVTDDGQKTISMSCSN